MQTCLSPSAASGDSNREVKAFVAYGYTPADGETVVIKAWDEQRSL